MSNVELSAVNSNLLISFLQHGGVGGGGLGLVMTGLQTGMKLSLSVSFLQVLLAAFVLGGFLA